MKLPHYQVLKVSAKDATTLEAEWLDCVTCDKCAYLNVQNTKYLYAICERHGIEFKPFEDDTRTHFCAWGIKADRKTENCSEKPNNCDTCKHWWRSEEVCLLDDCQYEPKTEPQTERSE